MTMTLSRMVAACVAAGALVLACESARAEDCPGLLARQEIEGADGILVEVARALERAGHQVPFWEPGPTAAELQAWHDVECDDSCPDAPHGFDEVDLAAETLQEFAGMSRGLRESGDDAVATWQTWIRWFIDPDGEDDFDHRLAGLVDGRENVRGLRAWKRELDLLKGRLPVCAYADTDGDGLLDAATNPPCAGDGAILPSHAATIDGDFADEFADAQRQLDGLMGAIASFRAALPGFRDAVRAASERLGVSFGGRNPATYVWRDSAGGHHVRVQVSNFRLADTRTKKKGNFLMGKVCLRLVDYRDDGANTWVTVTRQDPSPAGRLWRWNPFGGQVTRMSRVSYSFDRVGLSGIR